MRTKSDLRNHRYVGYLPQGTEHFDDYIRAVHWAQDYALANRDLMTRNMIATVQESGVGVGREYSASACNP